MKDKINTKVNKYYLPAILWAILIFIGSSIPSASLPSFAITMKDLILHFIEYAIFGTFLAFAIIQNPDRWSWKLASVVLIIGIVYGVTDEIHQKFVEGRDCAFSDVLADSAGIVFGMTIFIFVPRIYRIFTFQK